MCALPFLSQVTCFGAFVHTVVANVKPRCIVAITGGVIAQANTKYNTASIDYTYMVGSGQQAQVHILPTSEVPPLADVNPVPTLRQLNTFNNKNAGHFLAVVDSATIHNGNVPRLQLAIRDGTGTATAIMWRNTAVTVNAKLNDLLTKAKPVTILVTDATGKLAIDDTTIEIHSTDNTTAVIDPPIDEAASVAQAAAQNAASGDVVRLRSPAQLPATSIATFAANQLHNLGKHCRVQVTFIKYMPSLTGFFKYTCPVNYQHQTEIGANNIDIKCLECGDVNFNGKFTITRVAPTPTPPPCSHTPCHISVLRLP
jgi:hypothetical protein